MELHTFFIFFSVIMTPEGTIKSFVQHVKICPSEEQVLEMHVPKLNRGEIVDWAATCLHAELPLKSSSKGLKT